jgi:hypothetical protein
MATHFHLLHHRAKGRVAQPCNVQKHEGEWVHGRPHGFGKEWYADGSTKEVGSGWRGGSPDPASPTFVRYAGDRSLYVEVDTAALCVDADACCCFWLYED